MRRSRLLVARATLVNAPGAAQDLGWFRYADRQADVTLDLPADLLSVDRGPTEKIDGPNVVHERWPCRHEPVFHTRPFLRNGQTVQSVSL